MKHSNQKKASPNVLSRTKTNTPRNAFNMSHDVYMHSPVGMLVPSFVQDVKPNDYFTLDVTSYARTVPVNTASFCRMTEYTDFFFVPYTLIWKAFDQLINPVPDVNSALSLASQKANNVSAMPHFTFEQLMAIFDDTNCGNAATDLMFNVRPKAYAARLLDMLGYFSNAKSAFVPNPQTNQDNYWSNTVHTMFAKDQRFNPYRLLAFNRIISDYFRQTDYTSADPRLFNIDDIESGTNLPDHRLRALLRCPLPEDSVYKYEQHSVFPFAKWNLDQLTACKPSQLYGSFNNPSNVNTIGVEFNLDPNRGSVTTNYPPVPHALADNQDIRVARALEKLARVSMSAPKTFREQQKAHFGISSDSCDNCTTRYLGTYRTDLEIGEVIASSNYEGEDTSNYLGQVAGKGTLSGHRNGVVKMHSKDFGIIIGIHYVKPEAEYQCNRLNTLVTRLGRSDFFVPEFDQLGLEPQYAGTFAADATSNWNVLGYQSRYSNLKSRVSEVHGNFQKQRSMAAWAMARNHTSWLEIDGTLNRFFVDPRVADTIFEVGSDGTEITDQFLCHYLYNATLVSDMSVNGTPSL